MFLTSSGYRSWSYKAHQNPERIVCLVCYLLFVDFGACPIGALSNNDQCKSIEWIQHVASNAGGGEHMKEVLMSCGFPHGLLFIIVLVAALELVGISTSANPSSIHKGAYEVAAYLEFVSRPIFWTVGNLGSWQSTSLYTQAHRVYGGDKHCKLGLFTTSNGGTSSKGQIRPIK